MIGVLSPDEIEALLRRQHVGRLGCVVDGRAYVVPITYAYADGCVYAHTLPGRKLAALRADPRACFEVDARDGTCWRSVVAEATFEEIADERERQAILARLAGAVPVAVPVAVPGVVFRLRLTAASGRFVEQDPALLLTDVDAALLGLGLRAGDDRNWPTSGDA